MAEIGSEPAPGGDFPPPPAEEAVCVFAFADAALTPPPPWPPEVFERKVFLHCAGTVAALAGAVSLEDYCGAEAERRLADAAWLAPRARRHAELIGWAMQWSPVFPVPFGALYSSLDSLTAFMRAHEARISDFLRAVAGKQEWELKVGVRFDRPEVLDALGCAVWPQQRALSKGARYMRLCRERAALIAYGREQATVFARDCVEKLRPLLADARELRVRENSQGNESVARYAILAADRESERLRARVSELGAEASLRSLDISMSGPWPPFSFRPDLGAFS